MISIKVSPLLVKTIERKFKTRSKAIFKFMHSLKKNPQKGDFIAQIAGIQLRELKYNNVFRFYYFSNQQLVKILDKDELSLILIKFEAMSKKGKEQQQVIDKLKKDLEKYGFEHF